MYRRIHCRPLPSYACTIQSQKNLYWFCKEEGGKERERERGRGKETIEREREREREGKRERRKGERGREEIINHMIVRSRLVTAE